MGQRHGFRRIIGANWLKTRLYLKVLINLELQLIMIILDIDFYFQWF